MANIEVNEYGTNKAIKAHILSDDEMREIGFTDCAKDRWYFCKSFGDTDISFNVTIPKNGDDIRIDVLDEAFLQPYDYQYILGVEPNHKFANLVRERVEKYMKDLQDAGVLSGHQYGEYI